MTTTSSLVLLSIITYPVSIVFFHYLSNFKSVYKFSLFYRMLYIIKCCYVLGLVEIDVSSNKIRKLPCVRNLLHLKVFRAKNNLLKRLPDFSQCRELVTIDFSQNILEVSPIYKQKNSLYNTKTAQIMPYLKIYLPIHHLQNCTYLKFLAILKIEYVF